MAAYDPNNVFAKILRGELPCHKVYEDEHTLALMDIMPRAEGHVLVIPKAPARRRQAPPVALPKIARQVGRIGMRVDASGSGSREGDLSAGRCEPLTPAQSITSSARARNALEITRPRALAVLMFTRSSSFVGSSMGKSPGAWPLRILSTKAAERR